MSQIEEKIKEQLLIELYTRVDNIYDFMEQHFKVEAEHEEIIIKKLNALKDQLYIFAQNSKLK